MEAFQESQAEVTTGAIGVCRFLACSACFLIGTAHGGLGGPPTSIISQANLIAVFSQLRFPVSRRV